MIRVAITSLDYADFLRLTLPRTRILFDDVTVLTHPRDTETARCAIDCGAKVIQTPAWFQGSAKLNKAAVLNGWLDTIADKEWILILDADILLPIDLKDVLCDIQAGNLYGVPRRMCPTEKLWNDFVAGRLTWTDFEEQKIITNGKAWGMVSTNNPAALSGYFHLWQLGKRRYPSSKNAAFYDVRFALGFPSSCRCQLPTSVLHLGPERTNWDGRRSSIWRQASLLKEFK